MSRKVKRPVIWNGGCTYVHTSVRIWSCVECNRGIQLYYCIYCRRAYYASLLVDYSCVCPIIYVSRPIESPRYVGSEWGWEYIYIYIINADRYRYARVVCMHIYARWTGRMHMHSRTGAVQPTVARRRPRIKPLRRNAPRLTSHMSHSTPYLVNVVRELATAGFRLTCMAGHGRPTWHSR